MEIESVGDVASLDPDLLQSPELLTVALKSNLYMVHELFSQFLSILETGRLGIWHLFWFQLAALGALGYGYMKWKA